VEVKHVERLDYAQAIEPVELGVSGLPHLRVHVDRIDGLGVRVLLHDTPDSAEHPVHRLAQVLAAVRRDEDETRPIRPVELWVGVALAHRGAKGIDACVASNPDALLRFAFFE
jgi:hypothetical protein